MDEYQVEDVMTEFLKKSLAQSEFDSTLGTSMSILSQLYLTFILFLSLVLSREIIWLIGEIRTTKTFGDPPTHEILFTLSILLDQKYGLFKRFLND